MATVMDMDMAMEATDTMATMARGRLRLPLMPSLAMDMVMDMAMDMAMAMEAMDIMDMDMARGRLRLPLLLSLAMAMVMDMAMDMVMVMDMAMEAMDITDTMARGLLMLSPDMDTMVMDMAMATMDKFLVKSFQSSVQREFGPFGTSLEHQ